MDYSNINIFRLMQTKMSFHSENQDILSQNVANADTPGYKAKKLVEPDFRRMTIAETHKLKVRTTNSSHLSGIKENMGDIRHEKLRKPFEISPVKNSVSLEEQMAMVSSNKHEYDKTTSMYRKTTEMFRTALGKQ